MMSYICEICGEKNEEGKTCSCVLAELKEQLKIRNKKYLLRQRIKPDILEHLLTSRGIEESLEDFTKIDFMELYEDRLLNQEEAARRIITAIATKEKIAIYGDYDCDGITGTTMGINLLKAMGADVTHYINDRFVDGFGINPKGVEALANEGAKLIVTVDNGIAGVQGVERAKELGIEVIVTDHHEPNEFLPDCLIVDPKQEGCPSKNKEITGVGVLYKVLLLVARHFEKENAAKKEMDLVALGTVADMGALLGENRLLVRTGLMIFNLEKGKYGIRCLIDKLKIRKPVGVYELGFIFGPILNAESRLEGKPTRSITLLTSNNPQEIEKAADELIDLNVKRKAMLEEQLLIGDQLVEPDKDFFFIWDDRIAEGIAGLVASRILETYRRPTIVLGRTKEGLYKGSGRSIGSFDLKKALDKNNKLLVSYGGHKLACGLTIEAENILPVKSFLETEGKMKLGGQEPVLEVLIDCEIDLSELTQELTERIGGLEPYGIGFKKPLFLIRGLRAEGVRVMGGSHSKFSQAGIDFIAFGTVLEEGTTGHGLGYPQINQYNGRSTVQFVLSEIIGEDQEICAYGTSKE